jgi:hypothetical protein
MIVTVTAMIAVWKRRITWLVPLLLVLLFYPHAAIAWHGDSNDVGRHALQAAIHFRLGVWTFVLLTADLLFTRRTTDNGLAVDPLAATRHQQRCVTDRSA